MQFNNGETVSVSFLTGIWRKLYRLVNEITSVQIKTITTGQILDIGTYDSNAMIVRPMSVSTEQYFDSTIVPPFYLSEVDNNFVTGKSYLGYYLDEINKLEELNG